MKMQDIPGMIFRELGGKSHHFQCKNGNYSVKNVTEEIRIVFAKLSDYSMLIVLSNSSDIDEFVDYDLLLMAGSFTEQSICNNKGCKCPDELIISYDELRLNIRKLNVPIITRILGRITDLVSHKKISRKKDMERNRE